MAIVAVLLVTRYRLIAPVNQNPTRENHETHEQSNPHKPSALGLTLPERLPEIRRFTNIDYLQCPPQARIVEETNTIDAGPSMPRTTRQLQNNSTAGKFLQRKKRKQSERTATSTPSKEKLCLSPKFRSGSSISKKETTRRRRR